MFSCAPACATRKTAPCPCSWGHRPGTPGQHTSSCETAQGGAAEGKLSSGRPCHVLQPQTRGLRLRVRAPVRNKTRRSHSAIALVRWVAPAINVPRIGCQDLSASPHWPTRPPRMATMLACTDAIYATPNKVVHPDAASRICPLRKERPHLQSKALPKIRRLIVLCRRPSADARLHPLHVLRVGPPSVVYPTPLWTQREQRNKTARPLSSKDPVKLFRRTRHQIERVGAAVQTIVCGERRAEHDATHKRSQHLPSPRKSHRFLLRPWPRKRILSLRWDTPVLEQLSPIDKTPMYSN